MVVQFRRPMNEEGEQAGNHVKGMICRDGVKLGGSTVVEV